MAKNWSNSDKANITEYEFLVFILTLLVDGTGINRKSYDRLVKILSDINHPELMRDIVSKNDRFILDESAIEKYKGS